MEEPITDLAPTDPPSASFLPPPSEEGGNPTIATGTLAEAFPSAVIPIPAEAEILLSTAEVQANGLVSFSLVIRIDLPADQALQFYRDALQGAQFTELSVPPAEGIAGQGKFTRAQTSELVDIAISDANGVETVSVAGQVIASTS